MAKYIHLNVRLLNDVKCVCVSENKEELERESACVNSADLQCTASGHSFVSIERSVQLLAEEFADSLLDCRHPGGSTHEFHCVDVLLLQLWENQRQCIILGRGWLGGYLCVCVCVGQTAVTAAWGMYWSLWHAATAAAPCGCYLLACSMTLRRGPSTLASSPALSSSNRPLEEQRQALLLHTQATLTFLHTQAAAALQTTHSEPLIS